MLFSEIYGNYFTAIARIIAKAVDGNLTGRELNAIIQNTAFGESLLTIPSALDEERWPFLDSSYHTFIRHEPTMPLTTLQKQWMKSLLQNPRIKLFSPSEDGLEDVEPLYSQDTIVFYENGKYYNSVEKSYYDYTYSDSTFTLSVGDYEYYHSYTISDMGKTLKVHYEGENAYSFWQEPVILPYYYIYRKITETAAP